MTPWERSQIMGLVEVPGAGPRVSPVAFLRGFGAADGAVLGAELLRDAVQRRDPTDVEMALIVTAVFGVTRAHLAPLIELAEADWHVTHEDVVTELGRLRDPAAIDVLCHATWWVPDYLDYDESRALANKAVRAIGAIPGERAEAALRGLLDSAVPTVRDQAAAELARRS